MKYDKNYCNRLLIIMIIINNNNKTVVSKTSKYLLTN